MLAIDMVALIDEFCRIGCAVRCQDGAHEGVDVAFFVAHRAKGSALAQLQSEKSSFASHCRSGYLVWTYQLLKTKVAAFRDLYKMSHSFSHSWGDGQVCLLLVMDRSRVRKNWSQKRMHSSVELSSVRYMTTRRFGLTVSSRFVWLIRI